MRIVELTGTTTAGGALTVTSTDHVVGYIEKFVWVNTAADATADVTLTCEDVVSEPVLTITNQAQADTTYYPRTLANKVADASAFTDIAQKIFVTGAFKMVIAQGGATKAVRALAYVSDE